MSANLWLDDSVGGKYICYLCRSSLTLEALFSISFCSDADVDELSLLYWRESKLIVIETSNWVYLVNEDLRIIKAIDISFSIQGFYITDSNHLLILEEMAVKVVDYAGNLLLERYFGLIEGFEIKGNELTIKMDVGEEVIFLPIR